MLIFASGCKYDNTVSKYVYNYSNDTITVQTNTETFNLKPAEFSLVQTNEYKDQREAVPCGEHIEFTLTFSSGRTLIKAIDSTDAWE
ncbi:MAG: hypothetical protein KDC84_10925, partial [Crocinitomicaceae bacterium]|nr:hypothetical protein [Crocinitomicaceae bacterium]